MTKATLKPSQSCFLIAMPQLQDPNFFQTTTFVTDFNEDGAMGVVLNRPMDLRLRDALTSEVRNLEKCEIPIFWGGPVQDDVGWIIHEDTEAASESMEIEKGLYLSSSMKVLQRMVDHDLKNHIVDHDLKNHIVDHDLKNSEIRFRFFLGYAGWGAGQLEEEIAASSWVTSPLDRELIFADNVSDLWMRSLGKIGVNPDQLTSIPPQQVN